MSKNELPIWSADERASYLLRGLYRQHGYLPYHMSKFEEYDLYVRNKSFLVSDKILTFTDTDGRLMALKPDVTLSIVKNTPDSVQGLHKVYYNEHVYRTSTAAAGYREILQTGLECIGQVDQLAVAEVISLACQSLELIDREYLLDLSHMGFVAGMLTDLDGELQRELLTAIGEKNVPAIAALCVNHGIQADRQRQLERLATIYGQPSQVLPTLGELACSEASRQAWEELSQLCSLLEGMGCTQRLRLDFSIVNDMNYYNGVIFRGYLPGLASGVLSGGRYDKLLQKMGKQGGAIGFAVYLDQLEWLEKQEPSYDADVLLLYSAADAPAAVAEMARQLRQEGRSVRVEQTAAQEGRFREILSFPGGRA